MCFSRAPREACNHLSWRAALTLSSTSSLSQLRDARELLPGPPRLGIAAGSSRQTGSRPTRCYVLLQLEGAEGSLLEFANDARAQGCLIALQPTPLAYNLSRYVDAAERLLNEAQIEILFTNEWEAPTLLRQASVFLPVHPHD